MQKELIQIFPARFRMLMEQVLAENGKIQEIRLRVNAPLLILDGDGEFFLTEQGKRTIQPKLGIQVTSQDLKETLEYVSRYSLYAYEEELKQGFITIQGGHRIGVAGKVVAENGRIRGMKYIAFVNIRIAGARIGCADALMPLIYRDGPGMRGGGSGMRADIYHVLLVSPPRCGKTTLLRDMIRQISDGACGRTGICVGVVDERSELAACYQGIPQNDVGIRTDVLDCCPKGDGMMMLIRTMSPGVLAVDEIGSAQEVKALKYAMNCGARVLATVHGTSMEDISRKPVLEQLIREHWFERYVFLKKPEKNGNIQVVCDSCGNRISFMGGSYG